MRPLGYERRIRAHQMPRASARPRSLSERNVAGHTTVSSADLRRIPPVFGAMSAVTVRAATCLSFREASWRGRTAASPMTATNVRHPPPRRRRRQCSTGTFSSRRAAEHASNREAAKGRERTWSHHSRGEVTTGGYVETVRLWSKQVGTSTLIGLLSSVFHELCQGRGTRRGDRCCS